VAIPKGDNSMRGVETRGTGKLDGTSTMKRTSTLILVSCKVEGKLLTSSTIIQIMRNVYKEFLEHLPLKTFHLVPHTKRATSQMLPRLPPWLTVEDYKLKPLVASRNPK